VAWRVGLITMGTVTYFLVFVPLCLRESHPFLGTAAEIRLRRARQLTLGPYLTGGLLSCTAGTYSGPDAGLSFFGGVTSGKCHGLGFSGTLKPE
jgi:hypothetical protein